MASCPSAAASCHGFTKSSPTSVSFVTAESMTTSGQSTTASMISKRRPCLSGSGSSRPDVTSSYTRLTSSSSVARSFIV